MPVEGSAGGAGSTLPKYERIVVLDALRGLALLGILVGNIGYWSGWAFMTDQARVAFAGRAAFSIVEYGVAAAVDGKFYTIFSLLFGVGFAIQLSSLERRSGHPLRTYLRRLAVLFLIGLVHITLLYRGDILTLYALIGACLLLVRRWPDPWLLKGAFVLFLVPVIAAGVMWFTGTEVDTGLPVVQQKIFEALGGTPGLHRGQFASWLARRDWPSYFAWHLSRPPGRLDGLIEDWRFPKVFATMMLGLWVGRRVITGQLLGDRPLLKRICIVGLLLGVPGNLTLSWLEWLGVDGPSGVFFERLAFAIGVAPLGIAYAAGFALAWPKARRWLGFLAAPGRMALTNYLLQSVLCNLIFLGIGFGLIGKLTPLGYHSIVVAIFATQVALSHFWLTRFGQGPVERLWRLGTYGRQVTRPPLAPGPISK